MRYRLEDNLRVSQKYFSPENSASPFGVAYLSEDELMHDLQLQHCICANVQLHPVEFFIQGARMVPVQRSPEGGHKFLLDMPAIGDPASVQVISNPHPRG